MSLFSGKVIVVTRASFGIGRASWLALAPPRPAVLEGR